jgi:hypothetical protein
MPGLAAMISKFLAFGGLVVIGMARCDFGVRLGGANTRLVFPDRLDGRRLESKPNSDSPSHGRLGEEIAGSTDNRCSPMPMSDLGHVRTAPSWQDPAPSRRLSGVVNAKITRT